MFNFFRTHQRLMQVVLLILVLPSFVLIGVSGYSSYTSNETELVNIGGTSLTAEEFDQARRVQLQNMQQEQGSAFDLAVVDSPEARRKLLDAMVNRNVLIEIATKEGLSVSDGVLRQAIAAIPDFQVEGVFSPERYNTLLTSSGISIRAFEESQRADLTLGRVLGPVAQTTELPTEIANLVDKALTTTRKVELLNFDTANYLKPESITDAEVQAWYDDNQDVLRLPQYVDVSYVVLDEAAARKSVPTPTPEELKAYYDQNKSRFGRAERINLSHILVAVKADASEEERKAARERADQLVAEAKQEGADFAALAQENSDDKGTARNGGNLSWINRGALPDMDAAIFELRTGDVSPAVQSVDGFHIFKANVYEAESVQPLEELAAQLEQEIRQQVAAQRFADMATQLTSLVYESPESLQSTADALGLPVRHAKGVTRDGLLDAAIIGEAAAQSSADAELLNDPRVRRALFSSQSLNQRQNAGVIEVAADNIVAVRAEEIYAPSVPALDQVKTAIVERLAVEKAQKQVQEEGKKALASLTADGQLPAGDAKFGWERSVNRLNNADLSEAVVNAAMSADVTTLPSYVGVETDNGYSVIKVTGESVADLDPALKNFLQQQMRQLLANAEEQAGMAALRAELKVTEQAAVQEALQSSDSEEEL
ncbi:SurA N-terminal domain-containing protein [Paenalcaligenes suwonensis]|uniref:SurA N-terminal domain-containing protein n=1 Tax=Paenalcaligenes suwonensis TaxID=1202713 RepID=UPI00140DBCFF|nr:SurA N-terminal domain-containing protein [Paenalcaligenes suwonensis]NHC62473.1 peptidylprolyl isomerase [Paenalcaligenes suwonensis]